MASLVADYGESSGDSDENEGSVPENNIPARSTKEKKEGISFFGDNMGDSSDDFDSDGKHKGLTQNERSSEQRTPKLPNPFSQDKNKLPTPCLSSASAKRTTDALPSPAATSSVFVNPFEQAEQAKLGILEKHVRLTEAAPQKPATKQLCWKFKKGRCHLGDKCRFFHDLSNIAFGVMAADSAHGDSGDDFAGSEHQAGVGFGRGDAAFQFSGNVGNVGDRPIYHPAAQYSAGQPADPGAVDEDNYMANAKGKKRFGVTDSLLPPKRALMQLGELRKKERPWTSKHK